MTGSAPIPPPPSAPPVPSTEGRASARWVVPSVAAVVAAGAGIGLGWLLWSGADSAASGTGLDDAAADAAGACQVWARVPALDKVVGDDDKVTEAYWNRVGGASTLAHSAAVLDDRYEALDKAMLKATGLVQSFEVEGAKAVAAHDKVSTLCAELDD